VYFKCSPIGLLSSVRLFANASFASIEVHLDRDSSKVIATEKEITKQLFALLQEEGAIRVIGLQGLDVEGVIPVASYMKLSGF
jgi:hypothetical protein